MSDRDKHPTVALDPRTITGPNWPVVLVTLEQLAPFGTQALIAGLALLLGRCAHAMTEPSARAELVNEAQALVDALRFMPWDKK